MKQPTVKILEVKPMERGNLRAFVKIQIGPLVMSDFRIIQQPGQRAYVSPPQSEYEVSGKKRYKPLLEYPDVWKDAIENAALVAWRGTGGISES
jgi:hypothetical protein